MAEVVRLVHKTEPGFKACSDCAFYHPDTAFGGFSNFWRRLFRLPERWPSDAHVFAICSSMGGVYARIERANRCRGEHWRPRAVLAEPEGDESRDPN